MPTKEAVTVLETLAEAIELCGVPRALMSDNGTPFVTIVSTMLSRFQRTLAELSIRHIRTQREAEARFLSPDGYGQLEGRGAVIPASVAASSMIAASDAGNGAGNSLSTAWVIPTPTR